MCERQAGALTKVTITPNMIEAGIEAISPLETDLYDMRPRGALGRLVAAIYTAMSEVRCAKAV